MIKNSNALKSFYALILGLLFAIVISELFLHVLDFPKPPVAGWLSCEKLNPGQCNSMGFRGKEIAYSDDDFVVILLGDSEAYAAASPFERIPERRLEHFLGTYKHNVKVFTLADMGYGQDQQYLALKKYFERYRADLVLLMFTTRNDVENNIFPTAGKNNTIKPTFWLNDNEILGPTEEWLEPMGPSLKLLLLWNIYSGEYAGDTRSKIWEEQILPLNHAIEIKSQENPDDPLYQDGGNDMDEADGSNIKEMALSRKILCFKDERTEYGIDLTKRLFSKIKEITESNNGHFIIFKEERPNELRDPCSMDNVQAADHYRENLRELFSGFEHYRIPLDMENYQRSRTNTHLNESAIDKLMEELSLVISEEPYF